MIGTLTHAPIKPRVPADQPASHIDRQLLAQLRRRLLAWYRRHRRTLPWRAVAPHAPNPYHILVSEAMLQQTQVATVVPYFLRFIETFPTIRHLADAPPQRVLRLWQGLGYYRRARHLHQAAQHIVNHFQGEIPTTVDDLLKLPGIGRYTAGAIASIAFNRRAPILDGNVARVLARWFSIHNPINQNATRDHLWHLAAQLVPPRQPGDFNQALMELGALICTPKNPNCPACPVAPLCQAHLQHRTADLPAATPRKPPRPVTHAVVAIRRGRRYLFQQRPATGLWSHMWQLPTAEHLPSDADAQAIAHWLATQLSFKAPLPRRLDHFDHQTTHRSITFVLWLVDLGKRKTPIAPGSWRTLTTLDDLPLANPQRRAVELLNQLP
jgi:A/G-specific adenine glycosylase